MSKLSKTLFIKLLALFLFLSVLSCGHNSISDYKQSRVIQSVQQQELGEAELKEIFKDSTYRSLLEDVVFELNTFDGVDKEASYVKELKEKLAVLIQDGNFDKFYAEINPKWKNLFEVERLNKPIVPTHSKQIVVNSFSGQHTIQNLEDYVENRIGPEVFKLAKEGKIKLRIHGGELSNIASTFKLDNAKLIRLPSLYESWNIYKYLDANTLTSKTPTLYINVPPISEYVSHYAAMLKVFNIESETVINIDDRKNLINLFHSEVNELFLKNSIPEQTHVSIGYQRRIDDLLKNPHSSWEVVEIKELSKTSELKISGKLYSFVNKKDPAIKIQLLAISAETTLWGEATKFLADSILEHNPQTLTFMGSAGLIDGALANFYDATIPKELYLDSNTKINIENFIHAHEFFGRNFRTNNKNIIFGTLHGHVESPVGENAQWLNANLLKGIDTVDVENSLVAQSVAEYNVNNFANVGFGTINLVTDKPSTSTNATVDLDSVIFENKRSGQANIVNLYLEQLSSYEHYEKNFDANLKATILKHLPNISAENVVVMNGMGRVDASEKNKMSYFIYAENKSSPNGRIYLIPMATSRYDKYNYHTDEWWNKYGDAYMKGEKVTMEDPEEVGKYLKANNLSTNPDVIIFNGATGTPNRTKLQDFLLNEYLTHYTDGEFVYLYRGVAKSDEVDVWKSGQLPRGARYWTPDINYAWRYARKRDDILSGLVKDHSPIVEFKIPVRDFVSLVKNNDLILGTELPKSAHDQFENKKKFMDSLTGMPYLGNEHWGVELEVRAKKNGRNGLIKYFNGTVDINKLAQDRIKKIKATYLRLIKTDSTGRRSLIEEMQKRIATVKIEFDILKAAQDGIDASIIENDLGSKLEGRRAEISNASSEGIIDTASELSGKVTLTRQINCLEIVEEIIK